ncbi:MAG: hypothetical protein Kow0037_18320 [Calditrichia bacterium]
MSNHKLYKMQLTFLSDWHIGTGAGIPGVSDRAILRDEEGFPFIPGRTLRGILRDMHEQLSELAHLKAKIPAPEEIWGTRQKGAEKTSREGRWLVGNGELAPKIKTPLKDASKEVRQIWLNEFTFIAPRISLDPRKRVKEDHLAFIEMGRKGLQFEFTISRRDGGAMDDKEMLLLRLLTLTVQRLGGTRRRGKGRVELCLHADGNRQETLKRIQGGLQ